MNMNRRQFLAAGAAAAFAGCSCPFCGPRKGEVAVQLYSIWPYIGGRKDKKTGAELVKGVGLERALADVAGIGYKAVEFAGYYGFKAEDLKKMLDANGLKAAGTHVGRDAFAPANIQKTIDFNLAYGNNHLICPGGGMWPGKDFAGTMDDWWKQMVDFYARAADTANKSGCTLGYHNHTREFEKSVAMKDGTLMWDYFFSNTPSNVCMEQDVGWTTCAEQDPCYWFKKFPHRSPTLHAKENGCGTDKNGKRQWAPDFGGILGQPGHLPDGTPVKGVDWDALAPVADEVGVKYWVVECERNQDNLKAITESFAFLKSKGRC